LSEEKRRASSGGSWANLKLGKARYQCHVTPERPDGIHGDYEGDGFSALQPDNRSPRNSEPGSKLLLGQPGFLARLADRAAQGWPIDGAVEGSLVRMFHILIIWPKRPFDQYFEHIDYPVDMFDISTIAEGSKGKRKPLEIT
jgi:hypothetical protein